MAGFEFLGCGTRQLFGKFSGTSQRGSANRSRSLVDLRSASVVDSSQSVKQQLVAEQLSILRRDMEKQTERLNDSCFEVTEEWLLEFAGQHGQYMEKATSRAGSFHDFRSTTDLFQHVLQHPRVAKLVGDQPMQSTVGGTPSPKKLTPSMLRALASSNSPGQSSAGAQHLEGDAVQKQEQQPTPEREAERMAREAEEELGVLMRAQEVKPEKGEAELVQPKPKPSLVPTVPSKPTRSSSCAAICEATPAHRQRASWAAPISQPLSGESELMRKLQQRRRTSYDGLSPRSQRLAKVEGKSSRVDNAEEQPVEGKIAARRKLLERRLASCGFQKAAIGGA